MIRGLTIVGRYWRRWGRRLSERGRDARERPTRYLCQMLGKLTGWEDTIVAVATPPGVGAIGVIRVSGQKTFAIVGGLFPSKDLGAQATHTMHVGLLREGEETLD